SQGSAPVGSTATYVCATNRWSSSKARRAAFWPAASPSKVKMTSPPVPSSESRRRAILMWSAANAVPQGATARGILCGGAGHHLRVAFHHHQLPVLGDVPFGKVDPVQHLGLLVERGFRGVEVLGA